MVIFLDRKDRNEKVQQPFLPRFIGLSFYFSFSTQLMVLGLLYLEHPSTFLTLDTSHSFPSLYPRIWAIIFIFYYMFLKNKGPQVALVVKNLTASAGDMRRRFHPWFGKIPWWRAWQSTPVLLPGE